ncbi:hypothetical protein SEA_XIMENITA_66 [Mycobacterium phage Ximenita]|uniref:Uncharacterized protein n=1 Tax=Mycobacterium phage Ximenita TaxID=2708633 RepID=A0A6G6XRZ1_9CAUD|nr:hypothetical protein I5G82_gp041 [Mycobacterium phage Ximenita]QIG61575.1 hypothetical protein SEA_XIMENITA_66 [Mycobacterium phage Ximenita]
MSGHYMTSRPDGCACHVYPVRDPAEPQLGTWYEAEPNPACRVHFPAPWRIRRLVEPVPTLRHDEPAGQVVIGWVIEQLMSTTFRAPGVHDPSFRTEADYMVVDYYPSGEAAHAAFASRGVPAT